MPGFASIMNTGQGVPDDKAIQVYFTTSVFDIGMALRDKTTASDNPEIVQSSDTDPPGILVYSSQLASSLFMYFNAVFALTKQADPKSPKVDVSLVSPVYQPVASTESTNTTIASCSSRQQTWVYYLSGADQDSLRIMQSQIGKQGMNTRLEVNDVRVGSSLAAYFDPQAGFPFVIYQYMVDAGEDVRQFYEYSVQNESSNRIKNTDDAAKLSSIAAVHALGVTYLYYMDNDNELRVITKVKGSWGSSTAVDGASNVNDSSQITAVSSGEANHVFYTDQNNAPVHLMLLYK